MVLALVGGGVIFSLALALGAAHATAIGIQTYDTVCQVMSLQFLSDGTLVKTSNRHANTDPGRCWTW
ncbi:MAG: hypothetical protein RLZ91_1683, partial [Bacteroidota bacterium]